MPTDNTASISWFELKRPSISVGRKELDQLEDYVNAILAQPDFINTSTSWNFYLVSGEYDDVVKETDHAKGTADRSVSR
jgi:hypothetical protein